MLHKYALFVYRPTILFNFSPLSPPTPACDQCVATLYNSTTQLETLLSDLQLLVDSVEGLQEKDSELRSLDPEVVEVSQALNDLLEEFSTLRSEVEAIDSQAFEKNVSLLADMVRGRMDKLKFFSHYRVICQNACLLT